MEALTAGNAGRSRTAFPICRQIRSTLQCIYKTFCKVLLLLPLSTTQFSVGIGWVSWLSEGFFSLYGPVHDECVLAKPKCRKEPITPEMFQLLTKSLKDKSCIASSRTLALCLIRFAGFLRLSELCSIRARDVRLYSSHCFYF